MGAFGGADLGGNGTSFGGGIFNNNGIINFAGGNTFTGNVADTDPDTSGVTTSVPLITISETGDFGGGKTTPGATNVVFLKLAVGTDSGTASLDNMEVNFTDTSTAVDGDISAFKVYHDVDDDGTVSGGDVLLGSGEFTNKVATVTGLSFSVTTGSKMLLLTLDIDAGANSSHKVGLKLTEATSSNGGVDSFSIENDDDVALPVELSSFSAISTPEGVSLRWRTESETNNLGFYIYRRTPLEEFIKIAFIDGAGSTPVAHDYQFVDTDVKVGQTYHYYLEDIDAQGVERKSQVIEVDFEPPRRQKSETLSIRVQPPPITEREIPGEFRLRQNFPNPFNPETWLPYELPQAADVRLTIFNARGQVVRVLDLGRQRAGYYVDKANAAYWDGQNDNGEPVSSGVYFYRIDAGSFAATRKMVIQK